MPNPIDYRRIAFQPLHYKDDPTAMNQSIVDEMLIDPNTALPYFRKDANTLISSKTSISNLIVDILNSGMTSLAYIINNNRFIYRFYYTDGIVRLDRHLTIPKKAAFYRIRDISDANKYYVHKMTHVNQEAMSIAPFENNGLYFVEFYNTSAELISQVMFTAKFAPNLILNDDPAEKIFSHLQIVTNKDRMIIGESLNSLIVRLYAFYEDGTYKDVTDSSATYIDLSNINLNMKGVYTISATYIYDLTIGSKAETTYTITVDENVYANITNLIVIPRKIIKLNDNSKEIRLSIIAYFDNGTIRNVTDECIISNNYNDELFNVEQTVTIRFNAGTNNIIEKNVSFIVYDDGTASTDKVFFGDGIMSLDDTIVFPPEYKKYRVRHGSDLDFFYTINYNEINYAGLFTDKTSEADKIKDGTNVIVEFYDNDNNLLSSKVFVAKYKKP